MSSGSGGGKSGGGETEAAKRFKSTDIRYQTEETEENDRKGTPRDNRKQNRQSKSAARKAKLTDSQREYLHRNVSGQHADYHALIQEAEELSQWRRGEKPWKQNRRKK